MVSVTDDKIKEYSKVVFFDENERLHTELLFFALVALFIGIIAKIKYLFMFE